MAIEHCHVIFGVSPLFTAADEFATGEPRENKAVIVVTKNALNFYKPWSMVSPLLAPSLAAGWEGGGLEFVEKILEVEITLYIALL